MTHHVGGTVALVMLVLAPLVPVAQRGASSPLIETHDNLRPAGRLAGGRLTLSMKAGLGLWSPTASRSPGIEVAAFGEDGGALQIPSPLVRVPQGTTVTARIHNTLSSALEVHGLCDRPGSCEPVTIATGASRDVSFTLNVAGTFHYWATTVAVTLDARPDIDSQLGGAIVVDPPGALASDRVFVMGILDRLSVINGRSWPDTERLAYTTGETVHWRVVNLSASPHAMHLHGFYFRVNSTGDGVRDRTYAVEERRTGVTEQVPPGGVMTMTWVPERAGNWLFHCHMLVHMMDVTGAGTHVAHGAADPSAGMAGLVLGVTVSGDGPTAVAPDAARRRITMRLDPDARAGTTTGYKVGIEGTRQAPVSTGPGAVPGPVMVLTRGEPVAVDISNHLSDRTAIHWHGIELESYDDGVPGFGGQAGSITPAIEPGTTFTARFTPSRAGTFIYHTHWHDPGQLTGGVYGPLIVVEPGETFDPVTDHVVVLGLDGPYRDLPDEPFAVNGQRPPEPMVLTAGVTHRFRFINITADNVALTVQLASRFDPVRWSLVGKDGAETPAAQRAPKPARQLVSVGETYDFEVTAETLLAQPLWMELRRGSGEILMQWAVVVR
ncbi:MAG TPA: multicopper oxidase domain-containing protein [Vicinamibacterales bacterium]|nr:multicopper oxidase domain-containing protein [Vicinamibacterales bacterium]